MSRPTIGITSYWAPVQLGKWQAVRRVTFQGYVEGTRLAGGRPLVIPADPYLADDPDDVLDLLDGIVFVGGDDVAPELYGAERDPRTGPRNERRDAVELALMRRALERDLPVLAICRGIQVLNVARGGTLDPAPGRSRRPAAPPRGRLHLRRARRGHRPRQPAARRSWASGATVHSHHHQGIDRVGEGLVAAARADTDGIDRGDRGSRPPVLRRRALASRRRRRRARRALFQALVSSTA